MHIHHVSRGNLFSGRPVERAMENTLGKVKDTIKLKIIAVMDYAEIWGNIS